MSENVLRGPWPEKSGVARSHFGMRKVAALADVREALGIAAGRDRVKESAETAQSASAELSMALSAKVECAAFLMQQLAHEAHAIKNGRAATKLMAFAEQLETLAAECEP